MAELRRLWSRPTWIGLGAFAFALAAMAVDHLLGTEREEGESGLADPATFGISVILCLVAATLLFGWVVPRARQRGPGRAAVVGAVCSGLAIVPGIAFVWLGFPLVVAGAGVELGLAGRRGPRGRLALAAVVLGAALLVFGAVFYLAAGIEGVSEL